MTTSLLPRDGTRSVARIALLRNWRANFRCIENQQVNPCITHLVHYYNALCPLLPYYSAHLADRERAGTRAPAVGSVHLISMVTPIAPSSSIPITRQPCTRLWGEMLLSAAALLVLVANFHRCGAVIAHRHAHDKGPAAYRAILDVFLIAGRTIDDKFDGLCAEGAMHDMCLEHLHDRYPKVISRYGLHQSPARVHSRQRRGARLPEGLI